MHASTMEPDPSRLTYWSLPEALRETALQHSVDDAEGLLSNLMLSSALMLAFSVTLTTGTFSHDDLLEMDTRNAIIRDSGNNHESAAVLSGIFLEWGMIAVLCFTIGLFVGMLEYTSLCYSNCREDEEFFKKSVVSLQPLDYSWRVSRHDHWPDALLCD